MNRTDRNQSHLNSGTMDNLTAQNIFKDRAQHIVAEGEVKLCGLCGALNASTNSECFVCRWHGQFDFDPQVLEREIAKLILRCPDLAVAIIEDAIHPTQGRSRPENLFTRFLRFIGRFQHVKRI